MEKKSDCMRADASTFDKSRTGPQAWRVMSAAEGAKRTWQASEWGLQDDAARRFVDRGGIITSVASNGTQPNIAAVGRTVPLPTWPLATVRHCGPESRVQAQKWERLTRRRCGSMTATTIAPWRRHWHEGCTQDRRLGWWTARKVKLKLS